MATHPFDYCTSNDEILAVVGKTLHHIYKDINKQEKPNTIFLQNKKGISVDITKGGKTQFFKVHNDMDLVKSIISIYNIVGFYP